MAPGFFIDPRRRKDKTRSLKSEIRKSTTHSHSDSDFDHLFHKLDIFWQFED